jgi:hypothetical protein
VLFLISEHTDADEKAILYSMYIGFMGLLPSARPEADNLLYGLAQCV